MTNSEADERRREIALAHAVAVVGSHTKPEAVIRAAEEFELFLRGVQPLPPAPVIAKAA